MVSDGGSPIEEHRFCRHSKVLTESLILAQDERWRRASYMQVEREPGFGPGRAANGCVSREQPASETGITRGNSG